MPGHADAVFNHCAAPPPYCHGTGALWRVSIPVPPDFGRGTSNFPTVASIRSAARKAFVCAGC
jgi:hypothetical protein